MIYLISVITGYVLGSIPAAIIWGKIYGIHDIRKHGSGNMGTTNVLKVVGIKAAVLTFLTDMGKGLLAPLFIIYFTGTLELTYLVAFGTLLGHMFPLFAGFKGGKSIAVYIGNLLYFRATLLIFVFPVWILIYYLFHSVALSSMIAFGVIPGLVVYFAWGINNLFWYILIAGLILLIRHIKPLKKEKKDA